jgi:proteic killer suppression protein
MAVQGGGCQIPWRRIEYRYKIQTMTIQSFKCSDTERLFHRNRVKRFVNIESVARRKLNAINAAHDVTDLLAPPGNRLEKLIGDREGQYSIRINNPWRICFIWTDNGAAEVEIVDYH